jgi:glycosyltransferase involved in cell wall biosynthesis
MQAWDELNKNHLRNTFTMRYLYVIHLLVFRHNGRLFMDRAAALDIHAHQDLLPPHSTLVLAAPAIAWDRAEVPRDSLEEIAGVEFVPLRYVDGLRDGLAAFSENRKKLAASVASADFVHTGCGGFPFFLSPCYLAFRLALGQRKKVLFVMDCDLVGKLEMDQVRLTKNPVKKSAWYLFSKLCWHMYTNCLSKASATFLLGRGVVSRYGRYANNQLEIYQPIVGQEMIISKDDLQTKLNGLEHRARPNICFAGRLAPEKGLDVMFHAVSSIRESCQFLVNIYGDGPSMKEYQELAEELEIQDLVTFHGNMTWGEELFGELRQNHILVVPHLTLEMTRNVFDGMASGCAIIASNTKALAQLMDDSQAGVLFKTGDHTELAQVLANQLKKTDDVVSSIKNGIRFVRENNRNSHVQRRLEFLRSTQVLSV